MTKGFLRDPRSSEEIPLRERLNPWESPPIRFEVREVGEIPDERDSREVGGTYRGMTPAASASEDNIARLADGGMTAFTKGQRIEFGANGSIKVFDNKSGKMIFEKAGQ